MTLNDFKTLADALQAVVTALGIVIGGIWALRRYVFQKEALPRIEFRVDVRFIGMQEGFWIVELLGLLENKGSVPHRIGDLRFELRVLEAGQAPVEGGPEIQRQVSFAKVLKEGSWTPGDGPQVMAILPGVSLRYSHIAQLPASAAFALLHGRLTYQQGDIESFRSDIVVRVPKNEGELRASSSQPSP